jgi:TetR/AcrR family transcriptional regulator
MSDNRAVLLTTALHLFANQGYDAVGVQQIVEAAGVTKPTLYYYFRSKQGLLETLVHERSATLVADVQQATDYQGDITRSITLTVQAFFEFARHQPVFYRLLMSMWFAPPSAEYSPVVLELMRTLLAAVETMFERAVPDHGNMRGRQRRYALSLRGTIDTYIGLSFQSYIHLDDNKLIHDIVHQFMHGIFS